MTPDAGAAVLIAALAWFLILLLMAAVFGVVDSFINRDRR